AVMVPCTLTSSGSWMSTTLGAPDAKLTPRFSMKNGRFDAYGVVAPGSTSKTTLARVTSRAIHTASPLLLLKQAPLSPQSLSLLHEFFWMLPPVGAKGTAHAVSASDDAKIARRLIAS